MEDNVSAFIKWAGSLSSVQMLSSIGLLLLAMVLTRGLRRVGGLLSRWAPSYRLNILLAQTVLVYAINIGAGLAIVVLLLSPQPGLMISILGVMAVALGFSLKDLAASLFAGLVLVFDQPFQVGDRVTFRNYYGDIQHIGLRSVRLLTLGHDTVTIPNSIFLTEAVASSNSGSLTMMVTVNLNVALETNVKKALELLREVVVTSRYAWLANGVEVVASEATGTTLLPCMCLTARCYIVDVQMEKSYLSDITVRANQAFQEHGIVRYDRALIQSLPAH